MFNKANTALFTFDIPALTVDYHGDSPALRVLSFTGKERVSTPYSFQLELVSEDKNLPLRQLLGWDGLLTMHLEGRPVRYVHGVVHSFSLLDAGRRFARYQCEIVPRIKLLDKTTDHRIFQHKTVEEIITTILKEHHFTTLDFEFLLWKDLPRREYCVQYGETDLHFISRLLEEEGLRYFFKHSEEGLVLCITNGPGQPPVAVEKDGDQILEYHQPSGLNPDYPVIQSLRHEEQINSGATTYREWNFTKPELNLERNKAAQITRKGSDGNEQDQQAWHELEQYEYPHMYQLRDAGQRYADLKLERLQCWNQRIEGKTESRALLTGYQFTMEGHPSQILNQMWQVMELTHHGKQPQSLEEDASTKGAQYSATFTALPEEVIFRPALEHPKPRIIGDQTAIVTGPESEEIYPDEYGRVKVQFFWDREGRMDQNTTCWVRVSQGWAGGQYGTMAIPRIGHEVIVSFLEGDPDKPIITGRVYHANNQVPYPLPANKTRTVFKSLSSPGGKGFNELRIEDLKGEEEIYMHAEKDVHTYVKNNWKEQILQEQHSTVEQERFIHVHNNDHLQVDTDLMEQVKGNMHTTVGTDTQIATGSRYLLKAGSEIHGKAGQKVTIEAGTELTIKAGGSFIKLSPAGVTIMGPGVNINSGGSPGSGSGAGPLLPTEALLVAKGTVPEGVERGLFPAPNLAAEELVCAAEHDSLFVDSDDTDSGEQE